MHFLALWSCKKHTRGSSILTKIHRQTHLPLTQHPAKFQPLLPLHFHAASLLLLFLSIFSNVVVWKANKGLLYSHQISQAHSFTLNATSHKIITLALCPIPRYRQFSSFWTIYERCGHAESLQGLFQSKLTGTLICLPRNIPKNSPLALSPIPRSVPLIYRPWRRIRRR